jgi:hypothetical protein
MKKKSPILKTEAPEETDPKHIRKQIRLAKTKFYIHNLLITNKHLIASNNINNLILF